MKKKVYLIHGWGGSSREEWFDWLKKELLNKGFEVKAFDMPNTENPKIEDWVGFLEEKISLGGIDEKTYFVGKSIGCQTIIRFLEKLHKHKKIAGCVFVAGWFNLTEEAYENELDKKLMHSWTTSEINFERVLDHCNNFLAIFSDNDPFVHLDEAEKFKEKLGAKRIIKHSKGHFDEVEEIPDILNFIK